MRKSCLKLTGWNLPKVKSWRNGNSNSKQKFTKWEKSIFTLFCWYMPKCCLKDLHIALVLWTKQSMTWLSVMGKWMKMKAGKSPVRTTFQTRRWGINTASFLSKRTVQWPVLQKDRILPLLNCWRSFMDFW